MEEEGVTHQEAAAPDKEQIHEERVSNKEFNFRRLEKEREADREARIRAEMEAEMLRREMQEIKSLLAPREKDPLEDVEDYVPKDRLQAKLQLERSAFERRAKEIAEQTFKDLQKQQLESEKKDFHNRLKGQFSDYEQVMNETNLVELEKVDPLFVETALAIPDDYERRVMVYKKLKTLPNREKKPSIQERVQENQTNSYYVPPSSGAPSAVEFDVRSKAGREAAYARLKAAQRAPVRGPSK